MEIIVKPTAEEGSLLAGRIVSNAIRRKPRTVLGLATGSTPVGLYQELVRQHREEGLDFDQVTTFNLDEYLGLGRDHPCSYFHFMWENLFQHVNIPPNHLNIPDGLTDDVPGTCMAYERSIHDAGGIDLQVLGIGHDGHIGFNEPGSSLASRTRIKTLTPRTVEANRRFFGAGDSVPRHVLTMGIGTIMEARCCVLLAFGEGKADAIARMAEGPITARVPATVLQQHPHAIVILDEAAAGKLELLNYYRFVYENKPEWQRYEEE
jgi:glucosamine-6-phosphate deaminase